MVLLLLVLLVRRRRQKGRKVSPEVESRKDHSKRKSRRVWPDNGTALSADNPSRTRSSSDLDQGSRVDKSDAAQQRVELGAAMHRAASSWVESSRERALSPLAASTLPSAGLPAARPALPPIGATNSSLPSVIEDVEEDGIDVGQHWAFGEEAAHALRAVRFAPTLPPFEEVGSLPASTQFDAANRVLSKEAQRRLLSVRQSRSVLEGTQALEGTPSLRSEARPAPPLGGGNPVLMRSAPSVGGGLLPVRPAPQLESSPHQRRPSAPKVLELTGGGGTTLQPGFRGPDQPGARVATLQPSAERAALEMIAPTRRTPLPSAIVDASLGLL